jgi:hypothetical protein
MTRREVPSDVAHFAALSPEADLVGLLAGHGDEVVVVAPVVAVDQSLLLLLLSLQATTPHQLDELRRLVPFLVLQLDPRYPVHHLTHVFTATAQTIGLLYGTDLIKRREAPPYVGIVAARAELDVEEVDEKGKEDKTAQGGKLKNEEGRPREKLAISHGEGGGR